MAGCNSICRFRGCGWKSQQGPRHRVLPRFRILQVVAKCLGTESTWLYVERFRRILHGDRFSGWVTSRYSTVRAPLLMIRSVFVHRARRGNLNHRSLYMDSFAVCQFSFRVASPCCGLRDQRQRFSSARAFLSRVLEEFRLPSLERNRPGVDTGAGQASGSTNISDTLGPKNRPRNGFTSVSSSPGR